MGNDKGADQTVVFLNTTVIGHLISSRFYSMNSATTHNTVFWAILIAGLSAIVT